MKYIINNFLLLITVLFATTLFGQNNSAYEMNIDGVKVIVKPSGNQIVVVQTIIKGGVQNYPASKAGIESLALSALTECGAGNDDKNSFKDKLDKLSAQMGGWTNDNYATFRLNCIASDFNTAWPLYSNALLAPKFDEKEFARVKTDVINGIRQSEGSPDEALNKLIKKTAFTGKPFATEPGGTVETVSPITAQQAKDYWKSIFTRSRILFVVVGEIEKADLQKKMSALIAKIPQGKPFVLKKEGYNPLTTTFTSEQRDNATNYISGLSAAPVPGSADFNSFMIAMRTFAPKYFIEIRSKYGLSYAPQAAFSSGVNNYGFFYVTTKEPDKYIAVARKFIDSTKAAGFTAKDLKNTKTEYLNMVAYRNETNDALAGSLASNQVLFNDWRRIDNITKEIQKLELRSVNEAFRKYVNNLTWVYQGDVKMVNSTLFTQKNIPAIPQ